MARGRSSHGGGRERGALLACNRAIDRQEDFRKGIKALHFRAKQLAEALRPDGRIAEVLLAESDGSDAANDFLQSTHDRLKALAEGNAKRMCEVDVFVDAAKELRGQVEDAAPADGEGGDDDDDAADAPDYERSLHEAMERIRAARESDPSLPPPEDHVLSREVREALGEHVKKRSRASRGGDDEDDLEVVRNQTDDVHALKCPVTGMLFKDPVRNKVCGHTYDRAGLMQLLNNRKSTCPIPGCSNNKLSLDQVEDDEEMKLKVKRYLAREVAQRKKRQLEEEDDMDEGEGTGYTILE